MNRILFTIMRKEFLHISRDPQTLVIILLWPVIMLFLFGYAITLEMRQIETVVSDQSHTPQSRAYIEKLASTNFFKIVDRDVPESSFEKIFQTRRARCIIVIPDNFAVNLALEPITKIQLLVDATDPNAANYIDKYVAQINNRFNFETNRAVVMPFTVEPRMLYNPQLESEYFFVPGLIAVILLLISALLTSIAIVREKEAGTMEQILVSPVHPFQIIIGKVIPYTIIGFFDSILILVIGHFWFGVPVYGSVMLLGVTLILYITTGLSFGLMVSTITKSQQVAMMAALLATILPTIMLSGFIFPVNSMPLIFQYVSLIVPATHFLEIIRGIMLKGNGIEDLYRQIGYLLLISTVLIGLSIKKFKTNLE